MKKNDEFSMKSFQNGYTRIVDMKNNPDADKLPELLSQMGKQLVWGDHHETDYFQYFCEVKALDVLLEIFGKTKSKEIVTGIIGFFNILLTNITRKQTITYLLSHPCLLSLQNIKFVSLDSEIAEYYINFLKGLSRKLDSTTMHLFFNKKYPTFPLIMQTTRFYNHPENLVRTTCRNILLSCAKLENPKVKQFIGGFPFLSYYIHQCNFLKEYWQIIDGIIDFQGDNKYQLNNLDNIVEDQVQILVFFDDFMKINEIISSRFLDAFTNECLCPLLQGLYSHNKMNFSIRVALFICALLLKNITCREFCEFLVFSLFGKYYTSELCFKLMNAVEKPLSYSKQWKFKGFWDGYQNNIHDYCAQTYHNTKKIMSDINAEKEKYRSQIIPQQKYSYKVKSIFGMNTNFYDREVDKLQNIFGVCIKSDSQSFNKKSTSELMKQFKTHLNQPLDMEKCEENPVRQVIISYLSSKDDTLVFLSLNLLKQIINAKTVSLQMLHFCGLNTNPKSTDFSSMITIEKIIKSSLCIMQVEPPSFRICTYKIASQIIIKLINIYSQEMTKIPSQLLDICGSALKISIQRINPYIYGNKNWEKSIQIFNTISIESKKHKNHTLQSFGLLPQEEKNKDSPAEDVYDCFPTNQQQFIARDFWLYFIIRNTYCKLKNINYKHQVTNCDEKGSEKALVFQIDHQYEIPKDQTIGVCFKELNQDKFEDCQLIFLGGYVVIGKQKKVQYKCSYQEAVMTTDRSDPRKLFLSIGKMMLVIGIDTVKNAYEIRKHFLQMKTLMFKYQLSLLVKQTQWLLGQLGHNQK